MVLVFLGVPTSISSHSPSTELLVFLENTHPLLDDQDFMAATREPSRFGGGATSTSFVLYRSIREQNLEHLRKARATLFKKWTRRLDRAETRAEHRLWHGELPDSPRSFSYLASSNESDWVISIMEHFSIKLINYNRVMKPINTEGIITRKECKRLGE